MMVEFINEADVDDEKIIKYKKKDGESGEMKAGSAKSMPKDHPAKLAWDKMQDDGGDDSEKDSGDKLGGGDFDRDGGDEPDMDSDDGDDEKNAPEKENEQIEKELQNIAKDKGLTVGSEDANYGGEIHSLVGKDDDPDNVLGFHAAPNFDDDGNMTGEPQYAIELGMGSSPMYFGSKEEADAALEKMVDDEKIRKAMDGEGDGTLADLGDYAESLLKGGSDAGAKVDGPSPEDDWDTGQVMTAKLDGEEVGDIIGDEGHPKYKEALKYIMSFDPDDERLYTGSGEKEESIKVINGKKYKPIKESKKHILKENYDRIFRSRK